MTKTLAERFWAKVQVTPGCWLWAGSRNPSGYGLLTRVRSDGRQTTVGAHRVAYQLLVGPIPQGGEIDHLCKVRHCVNPAHLEVVSHQENMQRGYRANQTHCKRGHPLEGDNLYLVPPTEKRPTIQRQCRACRRILHHWYEERRRARNE